MNEIPKAGRELSPWDRYAYNDRVGVALMLMLSFWNARSPFIYGFFRHRSAFGAGTALGNRCEDEDAAPCTILESYCRSTRAARTCPTGKTHHCSEYHRSSIHACLAHAPLVRPFYNSHLIQSCRHIPPTIRDDLKRLRERKDNACGGKHYWADGCRALGVVESDDGLFIQREAEQEPAASQSQTEVDEAATLDVAPSDQGQKAIAL